MARHRGHGFAKDPMWPGINDLPWDEDDAAWLMVASVGEMSLEQVGECFGCTKERARQIEVAAKKKIEKALKKLGYDAVDVAEVLAAIASGRVFPSTIEDGSVESDNVRSAKQVDRRRRDEKRLRVKQRLAS
jgi:hypothetical protein